MALESGKASLDIREPDMAISGRVFREEGPWQGEQSWSTVGRGELEEIKSEQWQRFDAVELCELGQDLPCKSRPYFHICK